MNDLIKNSLKTHSEALQLINESDIINSANIILNAINKGKTIYWCGNGGSASQANHLSAELIGGMYQKKIKPFKSVCLNVDTAFITAWSNDDSFDNIFVRQLEALSTSGDILIGLSTSGNSPNVVNAAKFAHSNKLKVISLTGKDGGILKDKHEKIFQSKISKMLNSKTDIIITSGAVSEGKFDFVPNVIKNFSLSNYFKSVAIRPGKPILMAQFKNGRILFGLPGNPVSVAVGFRFFVNNAIRLMQGQKNEKCSVAVNQLEFKKSQKFCFFAKAKTTVNDQGMLEVIILEGQESFKLKPFREANSWAIILLYKVGLVS
mgnify:CR=1 FL=1